MNISDSDLRDTADDPTWDVKTHLNLLPPILHGFSFVHKKWGEFSVNNLQDVSWMDAPFQHLVIPDDKREIVRSLIEVHSCYKKHLLLSDVVQGKSSGCIIALYGNPGCGKVSQLALFEYIERSRLQGGRL